MTESPVWFNFPSFFRGDREGERHHVEAAAFRAFSRFVSQGLARDGLQRIVRPVALLPGRDRLAAADVVRELSPPAAPKSEGGLHLARWETITLASSGRRQMQSGTTTINMRTVLRKGACFAAGTGSGGASNKCCMPDSCGVLN
jgi:hypothetical protein